MDKLSGLFFLGPHSLLLREGRYRYLKCQITRHLSPYHQPWLSMFPYELQKEVVEAIMSKRLSYLLSRIFSSAARAERLDLIKVIMESENFDLEEEEDKREADQAFNMACLNGRLDIIKYMVSRGIKAEQVDYFLIRSACGSGSLETLKYLISQGVEVDPNENLLFILGRNGSVDLARYLVSLEPRLVNNLRLAVFVASSKGHVEYIKYMVSLGAEVKDDNEAFEVACQNGHVQVVKYFIESSFTNVSKGINFACLEGRLEVIKYLVGQGKKVSLGGILNAFSQDRIEIISYLVEVGNPLWVNSLFIGSCNNGYLKLVKRMGKKFYLSPETLSVAAKKAKNKGRAFIFKELARLGVPVEVNNSFSYADKETPVVKYSIAIGFGRENSIPFRGLIRTMSIKDLIISA